MVISPARYELPRDIAAKVGLRRVNASTRRSVAW